MIQYFIAVLAGVLMVASFAPMEWWFIAPVSIACLFYFWRYSTPLQSALTGFCFGFGMFISGVSWVYVSLKVYGGMPTFMGVLAVIIFAGILSCYIAIAGYMQARLVSGKNMRLIIMPFAWVVFEWIKGVLFTGFPWLDIGYTQVSHVLSEYAAIGGIYLVSFVLALCSALFVMVVTDSAVRLKAVSAVLLIIVLAGLSSYIKWSKPYGKPLNISVVQANIPIKKKWRADFLPVLLRRYGDLSTRHVADLTVWPEAALPFNFQQLGPQIWIELLSNNGALLTGIVDQPTNETVYNAAVLYCKDETLKKYRKKHLVPFGEYLPLKFMLGWVLNYLHIPMSDFSSWKGEQPLNCGSDLNVALSICYEDAFAIEVRDGLGDAGVLINISEDAWFGDSLAPHQRLQMARMRAIELARPMVRSANTGPSGFIDEEGRIIEITDQFKAQAIMQAVQPMQGQTLYARFGNWIIWLSIVVLILAGIWQRKHAAK